MSTTSLFRRLPLLLACVFVAAGSAALAPVSAADTQAATAPSEDLVWRGDVVFARSIMNELAALYARQYKGKLVLQPFSTVSGLDAVAHGSADLAGSARGRHEARPEEEGLNFIPVALDAITPIVHPRNQVRNLALTQLRDVYLGKITNWRDLSGPDLPINLYGIAAPSDGVEFSARALLFGSGDQRVSAPRLYLNTMKLEEAIAIDPAGLGFSTLSSVHDNKDVRALNVQFVAASMDNVANGSYPLFYVLYLATSTQPAKPDAISHFLDVIRGDQVKAMMRNHHLVPYTDVGDHDDLHSQRSAFLASHLPRIQALRQYAADVAAAEQAQREAAAAADVAASNNSKKRGWFQRSDSEPKRSQEKPVPQAAATVDGI